MKFVQFENAAALERRFPARREGKRGFRIGLKEQPVQRRSPKEEWVALLPEPERLEARGFTTVSPSALKPRSP